MGGGCSNPCSIEVVHTLTRAHDSNKNEDINKHTHQRVRARGWSSDWTSSDEGGGYPHSDSSMETSKDIKQKTALMQAIREAWKKAVFDNNEALVMFFFEDYCDQCDLLSTIFDNGDNSLHVACKKKGFKLAYFLISKGISVMLYVV